MTERFTCETICQGSVCIDIMRDNGEVIEKFEAINLLNEQHEQIQQLKIQLQNTSDQRDEFHHGARENANALGLYEQKVQETLQHFYNDSKTIGSKTSQKQIKRIAKELGVELK